MFDFMALWKSMRAEAEAAAATQEVNSAKSRVRDVGETVTTLRIEVDRLQMLCEGMWTLLKAKTGTTDAELAELVEQIDLRDGKLDGKVARTAEVVACPDCGRAVSVRTGACLFCGTRPKNDDLF